MAVRDILLLGNPALRFPCTPVRAFRTPGLDSLVDDLRDTLHDHRAREGFGRGIAAPQIGARERVVVIDVDGPRALVNPRIVRRTRARMLLWDDCFSLPNLLVRLRRHLAVDVAYQDTDGRRQLVHADGPLAELLQHEIDHLDGILTIDRAIDSRHIVFRSELESTGVRHDGVL
jgi:peptide deformylase